MLSSFAAVAILAASARAAPVLVSLASVEAALALPNTTQTNDAVWYDRESQLLGAREALARRSASVCDLSLTFLISHK